MTKKTYITSAREIKKITLVCNKCSSELHFPMTELAPEVCPFCKRRIDEKILKAISNLQGSLREFEKSDDIEVQFQTDYSE